MQHKFANRLINESSPYLLQHAHNPVNWYAWGEEALKRAKSEGKVILVSIGYSACHWCHVMEKESFESESVAQLMNDSFINIKIDREERPDLDHIYMDAVQAISGAGGWPLNVFLTPDAKPFFGGTYFPPVKAFNRSSWTDVLLGISTAWKDRRNEIESQAENLTNHLKQSNDFSLNESNFSLDDGDPIFSKEQCDSMFDTIMKTADRHWGGFGKAPKFPQTFTIQFLLQYHYFTGNEQALQQALLSIDKMLAGGIYDHVGGGLARYSTDNEWLAPHFEKMLYDNALLINILCDAYQITADSRYEDAIHKTILFITTELLDKEGGFYAALDADSEGEEGKYYVWGKEEIKKLLGDDSGLFCEFYDISEKGNWEEKNILRILHPIEDFIRDKKIQKDEFLQLINRCFRKLSEQRDARIKPALDDKIILGWNALMLRAVAKAGVVLQNESYRNLAVKNFEFLLSRFKDIKENVGLKHTYKKGVANYPAFLDDYAYLIAASIQLYKTTLNDAYIQSAYVYCDYVIKNFSDEGELFFYFTNWNQKDVIVRKKEIYDGAIPSGNAIMAENLFQLASICDKADWRVRAMKMLEELLPSILKYPGSFGIWASLLLHQRAGIIEIAVIGTDHVAVTSNLLLNFIPNLIVMSSATENMKYPLLANKPEVKPVLIYLCRNYTCSLPFSDTELLIDEIGNTNKITR